MGIYDFIQSGFNRLKRLKKRSKLYEQKVESDELTVNFEVLSCFFEKPDCLLPMAVEINHRRVVQNNLEATNSAPKIIHSCFSKEQEKAEREALLLWKRPLTTLYYFFLETFTKLSFLVLNIINRKKIVLSIIFGIITYYILTLIQGPHQASLDFARKKFFWWTWWIGLGFLSSCGFGTGLHTFVLYLGPFIAEVTIAAYECGTTDFPEPPYPDIIVCPSGYYQQQKLSILSLIRKTDFEAILWGLGTAIGELPPYFMARSARLSGQVDEEDEELAEFEEMVASVESKQKSHCYKQMSLKERMELFLHSLIQKAGFLGILLCASIPNPLFDLAGMTCGHFLVPFSHFFGATFIGKAIVKVHIQQIAIIIVCSEHYINSLLKFLGTIPVFGDSLKKPLLQYIAAQKDKLHNKQVDSHVGWLPYIINMFVVTLMLGFVVSIIHAFARDYHRRLCKWKHQAEGEIKVD